MIFGSKLHQAIVLNENISMLIDISLIKVSLISWVSNQQYSNTGSDDDIAPARWQSILS